MGWSPLEEGSIKLNTDEAKKTSTGLASAWGLIQDHSGNWLRRFTANIRYTDSFTTELWGLGEGLRLLDGKGYSKVVIKLDYDLVVTTIKEGIELNESRFSLVHDCIQLVKGNTIGVFHH